MTKSEKKGQKLQSDHYQEFEQLSNKYFEELKSQYLSKLEIARADKKVNAHNIFQQTTMREYGERVYKSLAGLSRFFYEITEIAELDTRRDISTVFNEKFNSLVIENKKEILVLLSEQEGLNKMWEYWRSKEDDFFEAEDSYEENNNEQRYLREFTTGRQVLAVYYLLNELNVFNKSDKTEIAKFIQFLTGKETGVKKISDTTIYKKVKKPFPQSEKSLDNDLSFVRDFFEKLNLQNIVDAINKDRRKD